MRRRDFLGAMLAACAAPAIVRAESIMRIKALVLRTDEELLTYAEFPIRIEQNPLFRGEVGRYENVRIIGIDAAAAKAYSQAPASELARGSFFWNFAQDGVVAVYGASSFE